LLRSDTRRQILLRHELKVLAEGVGDKLGIEVCTLGRRRARACRVPCGRAIVVPGPHDHGHVGAAGNGVEQIFPVRQCLRQRLLLVLGLGEVEGDIRRNMTDPVSVGLIYPKALG
jgi:hypothetical protein